MCEGPLSARSPLRHSSGSIAFRGRRILSLRTENTVNPAIFMLNQPHVVHVRVRILRLRHLHGFIPKAEAVDPVRAVRDGKQTFPVHSLDAGHKPSAKYPEKNSPPFHRLG